MRNIFKKLAFFLCSMALLATPAHAYVNFNSLGNGVTNASGVLDTTAPVVNLGSSTTNALVASYMGKVVVHNAGSAVADSLAQAGTTGFEAGKALVIQNNGAGAVTITPTISTINGSATLVLSQTQGAYIVSDGTNYFAFNSAAIGGSGTVNSCATATAAASYASSGTTVSCNAVPRINTANGYFDAQIGAVSTLPALYGTASNSVGNSFFDFINTASGGREWKGAIFASGANVGGDFCLIDVTGGTTPWCFSSLAINMLSGGALSWNSTSSANTNTQDTSITRSAASVISVDGATKGDTKGKVKAAAYISVGTKFTATGCSNSTTVGGATAGKLTSGTTGVCTFTVTMGDSATSPNGWHCGDAENLTTTPIAFANLIQQTASTTTTATFSGTTVSGDVIEFGCPVGY